jgi:hypothetical protein
MTYSQEQIDRANEVSLVGFLMSVGEEIKQNGKEYRWAAHDSMTIRDNKWYRHSQSKGGYPVQFVMEFMGKSFPEAMEMLLHEYPAEGRPSPSAPNPEFRLPKRNTDNNAAIQYLTEERSLDKDLVGAFVLSGDIYEDAEHHNVVFVGRDREGTPRYASLRGIKEKFRQDVAGSDKSRGFAYHGDGRQLFVFEAPIDLLSFIQLYPKDWTHRSYCSLGGVSGRTLERILSERNEITEVFLCLDNDTAGNDASDRLAGIAGNAVTVTRLVPARKDWNEVLKDRDNIPGRQFIAETIVLKDEKTEPPVPMLRMSEITPEKVEWLWYPYIPFGKLTIVQGNPGEGKTFFAMELAAACTNRKQLPGMDVLEPFNVIYQTAEDGLGDTVHPRLVEAGADLDRVLVIRDSDAPLTLSDDRIEKAVIQNHARLIVIDPVQAFLGADVDMNRANEVRPILRKLGDMAQRTGCSVLLLGHLNKASGAQSTYRGLGSIDITAAARSILLVGRVKKEPNIRVICHDKSSLAPEGQSIAFSLDPDNGFQWIGSYEISSDDLLSGKVSQPAREVQSKQDKAKELILGLLSDGKEVSSDEIDRLASEAGISERTVRLVKANLREEGILCSRKEGQQWIHFLKAEAKPPPEPDWSDPMERLKKTSEILGWQFVDITDAVIEKQE